GIETCWLGPSPAARSNRWRMPAAHITAPQVAMRPAHGDLGTPEKKRPARRRIIQRCGAESLVEYTPPPNRQGGSQVLCPAFRGPVPTHALRRRHANPLERVRATPADGCWPRPVRLCSRPPADSSSQSLIL